LMNVASSKRMNFNQLKALSKKVKVTINDIVMSAMTTGLNKLFKDEGDKSKDIQIYIPANIRFAFYPTPDKIKLENKFAAIPLTVPLTQDMPSAYPQI